MRLSASAGPPLLQRSRTAPRKTLIGSPTLAAVGPLRSSSSGFRFLLAVGAAADIAGDHRRRTLEVVPRRLPLHERYFPSWTSRFRVPLPLEFYGAYSLLK